MSEKVKVSREVADFLRKCESNGVMYWEDELLYGHTSFMNRSDVAVREDAKCLSKYSTFELAQILVLGYEVEETPEEKVREKFKEYYEIACTTPVVKSQYYANGFTDGIRFFAYEYGIKIEGINK